MPPSPRERPPPGPSPRGKGIGASPERDAAARRSLTSSLTSSVPPRPVPGTAVGDGGTNAPATTSHRASAYYESSTNLLRFTPDAEARASNPRDGAGSSARRSIESIGFTAVGLGLGRGRLGVSASGASLDAAYRDAMRASTESGRSEVDAQTAENAKIPFVAIRGGYDEGRDIGVRTPPPDAVIDSPRDLPKAVMSVMARPDRADTASS